MDRRRFLQSGSATLAAAALPAGAATANAVVGVGSNSDPYQATSAAIAATGTWPGTRLSGKTVFIKPNLVAALPASSGATTDPEVVRCVVDLALNAGAAAVIIVEAGRPGAFFDACGYSFFRSYHPRVSLVDLGSQPTALTPVPSGYNYGAFWMATLLNQPNSFFISVAKLKTHALSGATASCKNLFGIIDIKSYLAAPHPQGRFALHDRGLTMSIVDSNRLKKIDYAIIDGVYGMEGPGPLNGTPVQMDLVLAGSNAVSVDSVALSVMRVPLSAVPHLSTLGKLGFGPTDLTKITVSGASFTPRTFARTATPPNVALPTLSVPSFSPSAGQTLGITQVFSEAVIRFVEVLSLTDQSPTATLLRTVAPQASVAAGVRDSLTWDGRATSGALVPAGRYAVHTRAVKTNVQAPGDAISWVTIT
ncbi:MAG: DUF362 domain-containing protein [Bryobacteraceae bacterium]